MTSNLETGKILTPDANSQVVSTVDFADIKARVLELEALKDEFVKRILEFDAVLGPAMKGSR